LTRCALLCCDGIGRCSHSRGLSVPAVDSRTCIPDSDWNGVCIEYWHHRQLSNSTRLTSLRINLHPFSMLCANLRRQPCFEPRPSYVRCSFAYYSMEAGSDRIKSLDCIIFYLFEIYVSYSAASFQISYATACFFLSVPIPPIIAQKLLPCSATKRRNVFQSNATPYNAAIQTRKQATRSVSPPDTQLINMELLALSALSSRLLHYDVLSHHICSLPLSA